MQFLFQIYASRKYFKINTMQKIYSLPTEHYIQFFDSIQFVE